MSICFVCREHTNTYLTTITEGHKAQVCDRDILIMTIEAVFDKE
jgi:hypothetical protein